MIISGCDIETTGLEQSEGHRIIEVCFRLYESDTRELVNDYITRINPQRPIDAKAREVHGISIDDLVSEPKWEGKVANSVRNVMGASDVLVAHNMNFDGPFIALELARVGVEIPNVATLCTMAKGRWATPLGKNPKLSELCFALGVEFNPDEAHSAVYDVDKMMECFWAGLDRGFYTLPEVDDE